MRSCFDTRSLHTRRRCLEQPLRFIATTRVAVFVHSAKTGGATASAFLENCSAGDFSDCGDYDAHMGPELCGRLCIDGDPDDSSGVATGGDAPAAAAAVAAVKSHTFIDHDVADLRVGDVPQLLAEYKRLARAFDMLTAQTKDG